MEFPASMYKLDMRLRFSDIDSANIAYFARFPSFFDESFIAAMRENDVKWDEHKKFKFMLPIVEQKTVYFHPLKMGDVASIYFGVSKIGSRWFKTQHVITVAQDSQIIIVATGYINRVTVDYNSFKPIVIPELMMKLLTRYKIDSQTLGTIDPRLVITE